MFKCQNCNKEFKYESKLKEHKNRKILCNAPKKEYKCIICKVNFICPAEQTRHEKTQKHLSNLNINLDSNTINYQEKYEKLKNENYKLQKYNEELENKNLTLTNENHKLTDQLNNLNDKFNILEQLSNKELINTEYIYIIYERTFVKTNANIYKIGKTKNIKNRLNGYSKGSKLLFTIPCNDCSLMETIILNYLKSNNNYIQVKEYGNEYFSCNLTNLINDIHIIIKENN